MKHLLAALTFCLSLSAHAQLDEQFYRPSSKWAPIDSLQYEEVTLPADTAQVTGIFLKPAGKPKATILFFHGSGGNIANYVYMTKPLVANGYQVFMVDFRGYGRSTGKPTHQNIATDGQMILDYQLQRKELKKQKLIIYGASVGSQVAVNLAKNNEAKLAGLVLDGTVSSFTDLAADHSPEAQREFIRKSFRFPYAAKEDIRELKTLPVLFIHSKEDKDVPFAEGEAVYENASTKKQWVIYEGKHLEAMKLVPQKIIIEMEKMITR